MTQNGDLYVKTFSTLSGVRLHGWYLAFYHETFFARVQQNNATPNMTRAERQTDYQGELLG